MIQHKLMLTLAVAMLAAGSGCCLDRTLCCGQGYGGPTCGGGAYGGYVEPPGNGQYDNCGEYGSCGRGCLGNGLGCIEQLLVGAFQILHSPWQCGAGCGEVYVDDWQSDPPPPYEPCGQCGNWTGHRPGLGKCHGGSCLSKLWGHQGGYCGGCRGDGRCGGAYGQPDMEIAPPEAAVNSQGPVKGGLARPPAPWRSRQARYRPQPTLAR